MKAKKIVALLAGSALIAAMAIPMAACSGNTAGLSKSKINLSNYAKEYESNYDFEEPTIKELTTVNQNEIVSTNYGLIVTYKSGTYSVYSMSLEKQILSGLGNLPDVYSAYYMNYIRCADSSNIKLYTMDGKLIASYSNDYNTDLYTDYDYYYVNGETELSRVYTFTVRNYYTDVNNVYYVRELTDDNNNVTGYEILSEDKLSSSGRSDYEVGGTYNGLLEDIYVDSEDKPVEGEITKYQYSSFGDTYTFYKDGKVTGSVEIKNGERLAFVNNYMYYCTATPVSSGSDNYNFVVNTGSTEVKSRYTFARYDIVKNSTKVLKYDLVVNEMYPVYNYNTKAYDAAFVKGYEIVDGVAFYGASECSLLVDEEFKLVGELNGVSVNSSTSVYSIGEDNYYIDGYIFDKDLNVLNSANSVYDKAGLIRFSSNGNYGFTDLNGKIVIAPKYRAAGGGNIVFYGGAAYVYELQSSGLTKPAILKADGKVTYIEDLEKASGNETKTVNIYNGLYTVTVYSGSTVTTEIFTLGGKSLKKVQADCRIENLNGFNYLMVTSGTQVTFFKIS